MAENNGKQSDSPEETDDLDRLQPEEPPTVFRTKDGGVPWALWHLMDLKRKLGDFDKSVDVEAPGELFDLDGWGFETNRYVDRLAVMKGNLEDLKVKLSEIDHEVCEVSRHSTDADRPSIGFSVHYAIAVLMQAFEEHGDEFPDAPCHIFNIGRLYERWNVEMRERDAKRGVNAKKYPSMGGHAKKTKQDIAEKVIQKVLELRATSNKSDTAIYAEVAKVPGLPTLSTIRRIMLEYASGK